MRFISPSLISFSPLWWPTIVLLASTRHTRSLLCRWAVIQMPPPSNNKGPPRPISEVQWDFSLFVSKRDSRSFSLRRWLLQFVHHQLLALEIPTSGFAYFSPNHSTCKMFVFFETIRCLCSFGIFVLSILCHMVLKWVFGIWNEFKWKIVNYKVL